MTEVVLSARMAAVPLVGVVTAVTERVSPSASVSLEITLMSMAVSSSVEEVSSTAVGAVLVGVTVAGSLAGLVPTSFVARIWKLYSWPLVRVVTV